MPKKPLHEKDVLVPCRFLVDTKSEEHRYRVAQTLECEVIDLVIEALVARGHSRSRSIYLRPYREKQRDPDAPPPFVPLERRLSPKLRLIFGSRPPMFEDRWKYPRIRKPTYHELEYALNYAWLPFVERKRRDVLKLTEVVAKRLPGEFADRADIVFGKREGSFYQRLAGSALDLPKEPRTCGFVLNKRDFYQGASLTSFFAMDGLACLILGTLITERHPDWLDEPGWRMVELVGKPIPPQYESLDFIDDWEILSVRHLKTWQAPPSPLRVPPGRLRQRSRAEVGTNRAG